MENSNPTKSTPSTESYYGSITESSLRPNKLVTSSFTSGATPERPLPNINSALNYYRKYTKEPLSRQKKGGGGTPRHVELNLHASYEERPASAAPSLLSKPIKTPKGTTTS